MLLTAVMISSCSGFLDEENKGQTTAENYYTTADGYEGLVNSAYANLRDVFNQTPYIFMAGTDLFFGAHQEIPLGLSAYQTLSPSEADVEDLFRETYQSIQITNIALDYASQTESFPELDSRIGEMKALRAYYYFLLVQHFGDVTLVEDAVSSPIVHFERTPASQVYEFVISELMEAIDLLPETQSDFGRFTSRAAQHILAKVYLTRGYEDFGSAADFSEAASLADEAIDGYDLNTVSYMDLFAYGNDNNEEVLFSIQYSPGSTVNSGTHNWDYPWGPLIQGSNEGVNKKNILHPTERLFELFRDDTNDERFRGTFMFERTSPYSGWSLDRENSIVSQYFPLTAAEIADTANWRAADPANRADASIYPFDAAWWDGLNQESFPSLRKFDRLQDDANQYSHDIYLARLGETYLIAAEAYFQAGNTGLALDRLNAVRNRAGATNAPSVDIDVILDERARELAGEGHRWMDLKRTGKLMEYTKLYNPDIVSIVGTGVDPFAGTNGIFKILRPIPLSAISLDAGEYPQNPAYQ